MARTRSVAPAFSPEIFAEDQTLRNQAVGAATRPIASELQIAPIAEAPQPQAPQPRVASPSASPASAPTTFQGFSAPPPAFGGGLSGAGGTIGFALGGPVGGAIGAGTGLLADLFFQHQASKKLQRAEEKRLAEARRQQQAALRRDAQIRAENRKQFGLQFGLQQAGQEFSMEQTKLANRVAAEQRLKNALVGSINNNANVRGLFVRGGF